MAAEGQTEAPQSDGVLPRQLSHQRSRVQEEEDVVPSGFEKFIYNRPLLACLSFLGVALFLCVLAGAMFGAGVVEVTTDSVWDVLGDIDVKEYDAYRTAKDDGPEFSLANGTTLERSDGGFSRVTIVYEVKSGKALDENTMKKIMELESVLLNDPEWQNHCQLIYDADGMNPKCTGGQSVLTHYRPGASSQQMQLESGYGPCSGDANYASACIANTYPGWVVGDQPCVSRVYNPIFEETTPVPDEMYKNTFRCMCCAAEEAGCDDLTCDNTDMDFCGQSITQSRKSFRERHIGEQFNCGTASATLLRSFYSLGLPRDGFTSTEDDDDVEDMVEKIEEWTTGDLYTALFEKRDELIDDDFEIYIFGAGMDAQYLNATLITDQFLAIGSVFIVFFWIWCGTASVWLALCGMIEIILSIPLAIFVWGALQGQFVSFFMLTIVFLILGIGADDIFVLWDAVQQSFGMFTNEEDPGCKQFAWALRRARSAMTVTSATTFCALILAGASTIPSLSAFGIFGALVILFDFIMVITFYPAAIVVYLKYFRTCKGPCGFIQNQCGKLCGSQSSESAQGEEHLRAPEKFFRDKWSPTLNTYRIPIAITWAIIGVAGIIVPAALLRPASEAPAFFNDDFGVRYMDLMQGEDFVKTSDDFKVQVHVVFGIDTEEPIDRAGTNYQDTEEIGDPVYKDIESTFSSSAQWQMWQMCENARSSFHRVSRDEECNTTLVSMGAFAGYAGVRIETTSCQTGAVCFIDWVRDFRLSYRKNLVPTIDESNWHEDETLDKTLKSSAFSAGVEDTHQAPAEFAAVCGSCCQQQGWYICLLAYRRSIAGLQNVNDWLDMSRYYVSGGNVQWGYFSMNATLPTEALPLADIEPHYDDWDAWTSDNLGPVKGYSTCVLWVWMVTQREIVRNLIQSIGLCLMLALIILLLSTTNWMISLISFCCILLILLVFCMMITAIGWDLGIFESVGMIVVIGLSVDYSVHIGHSFNETRFLGGRPATRYEKAQHSLTEMGISVISGSMTTLLASVFLLPAKFKFYHVFGIFMLITVIVSTLVALTLLPVLFCIIGPEGESGDIMFLNRFYAWVGEKVGACCGGNKAQKKDETI